MALGSIQTQVFTIADAVELYRRLAALQDMTALDRNESIAKNHLRPFLGADCELAKLQTEQGLNYLAHRKNQSAVQGPISREWSFFMRLLNLAVDYEKIPHNRMRVIDVPKGDSRKGVATIEELDALQAAAIPELWRFIMAPVMWG